MNPGQDRLEEAGEWLRIAADDLRLAHAALDLDPPIVGLALFHAQQAVEKALKGSLVFNGRTFPFTHNLNDLARPLAVIDPGLLAIVEPGLDLSGFSTLYRYPGEPEMPDPEQAQGWLQTAGAIFAA